MHYEHCLKVGPSSKNKADELTRVPKSWLNELSHKNAKELYGLNAADEIRKCHSKQLFGVNRTMFTVTQRIPQVLRKYVKGCERSI